jgi:hypothetical protein
MECGGPGYIRTSGPDGGITGVEGSGLCGSVDVGPATSQALPREGPRKVGGARAAPGFDSLAWCAARVPDPLREGTCASHSSARSGQLAG